MTVCNHPMGPLPGGQPPIGEKATGGADPHRAAGSWQRETKSLGQVATPRPVAQLMARWVTSTQPRRILDPAAGLGSLLQECYRLTREAKLVGVERDQTTLLKARHTAPPGTELVGADYLLCQTGLFEGIIANPPYVKARRLGYSEGTWREFEARFGTRLDRLTNLYALFLLKIWQDLAAHGRAAVLIPAEVLNANFGEEIKERLLHDLRPAGLLVFASTVNLFADALTTSAIVFLEKHRPANAGLVATTAESLGEAKQFVAHLLGQPGPAVGRPYRDLSGFKPRDKWLNLLFHHWSPEAAPLFAETVGTYFECRRGIATGANRFFCLSPALLKEQGLTLRHVDPCLTKATDATGLVFSAEKFAALEAAGRRCYLLNPRENGPALQRYLQAGKQLGIPLRHLPSHRPVWYLPENRAVANIWVAAFSRATAKCILNDSGAKSLTCFHGLYAKAGYEQLGPLMTLYLNSSWGREAFSKVNRFYGDGLNKLEPKDVASLPCPAMPKLTASRAKQLREQLMAMEMLPLPARQSAIDKLTAAWLGTRRTVEVSPQSQAPPLSASTPQRF